MNKKTWRHCPLCANEIVDDPDGGPRKCGACDFVHWDNPTPVVALIVETPEGVVLARNHGWPAKMFGLPTGFVDAREDPSDAARRELKEELDVEAEVELFDVVGFAHFNQILLGYHVRTDARLTPGDDLAEIKLVAIDRLKPKPFGTGVLLQRFVERARGI